MHCEAGMDGERFAVDETHRLDATFYALEGTRGDVLDRKAN